MELKIIKIDELKPDPKQPRQFIDQEKINEMAVSIKNEGIINPIEIDKDHIIITGEMRWRAAKKAGLIEIPIKILPSEKSTGMPRFIRQMHENLHHNTMSIWDTTQGLKKVADGLFTGRTNPKGGRLAKIHARELSKLFGISIGYISELLQLLSEPKEIQELLKNRIKIPTTLFREIKKAPEEYQDRLKRKAIAEGLPRDSITYIVNRLQNFKQQNPEKAKKILDINLAGKSNIEIIQELERINSGMEIISLDDKEILDQVYKKGEELITLLNKKPFFLFKPFHQTALRLNLILLIGQIIEYFGIKSKKSELTKLLENHD